MLQPILTKVAQKEELNIDLVTVDTEALEDVAQKYQVRSRRYLARTSPQPKARLTKRVVSPRQITSLPTVFAFRDGQVVDKFSTFAQGPRPNLRLGRQATDRPLTLTACQSA